MKHSVKTKQSFTIDDNTLVRMVVKQMANHIDENKLDDRKKNLIKAENALRDFFNFK